jgi:pimeloyl-ACP methyl ester carboxylesterase
MRKITNRNPHLKTTAFFLSILLTMLLWGSVSGQQKPIIGYAPVNGLKMYYEIHGSGEPVVLLHGAFMAISDTFHWTEWIGELSKTRKVIAIEMQGHGRTADIKRDFSYDYLADDVAALLDYLKIPSADVIGYSLGGGVALNCAIRHPDKVRKVVSISAVFRLDGWTKEALAVFPQLTAEAFKGSPMEADYKRLSPTPNEFPNFVRRVLSIDLKPHDFGADKLRATKAPMFFIHGDADGVRLDYIAETFRLNITTIVPMVNDFLDGKMANLDAERGRMSPWTSPPCGTSA